MNKKEKNIQKALGTLKQCTECKKYLPATHFEKDSDASPNVCKRCLDIIGEIEHYH